MAEIITQDVTPVNGSDVFPVNDNEVMNMVETLARQEIRNAKSGDIVEDAFYDYEIDKGKVVESSIIKMATAQAFDKNSFSKQANDPEILTKYFNKYDSEQYITTTRRDEIRSVLKAENSVDSVVGEVIDSLTQGDFATDFTKKRALLLNNQFAKDYSPILGGKPANMKGVIYALRNMYNHLLGNNSDLTSETYVSSTPRDDIRIAISRDVLDLIDIVELANVFNLEKEEILGKLVIINTSDLVSTENSWINNICVYDRKAMGRATRLYEYEMERVARGRYENHYLTTERMYFFNGLFKCAKLDVTSAVEGAKAELITPNV